MRIGIVGAGAAGLMTAWLLDSNHDVIVFERRDRPGGHVDTVDVEIDGERVAIEAGFEFFDTGLFPTFVTLLATLGVATRTYAMTLTLYHARDGLIAMLPPVRGGTVNWRALSPRRVTDMLQLVRVQRAATRVIAARDTSVTIGDFLGSLGLTRRFREGFIYPMLLACWDVDRADFDRFAAWNVLQYIGQGRTTAQWREVVGGGRAYVDTLARRLVRSSIKLSTGVSRVRRDGHGYAVHDETGHEHRVDHLVVATGPHEARSLLGGLAEAEFVRAALAAIEWFKTTIAVHGDRRLMPPCESQWSVVNTRFDGVHSANTVWKRWKGRGIL